MVSSLSTSQPSIRLIATDLDGTLLHPDWTLSSYTVTVLKKIQAMGIHIVLVSARPPRSICAIAKPNGLGGLAICCNGAIVYDLDRDIICEQQTLSTEQTFRAISLLRSTIPHICFAGESGLEVVCDPVYSASRAAHLPNWIARSVTSDELYQIPLVKLLAYHPHIPIEDLYTQCFDLLNPTFTVTHSGANFIEINANGINKASALARLCTTLQIESHEVIAFGDMPNDIPMLQWAGHAIAVANAHPHVLDVVDTVTRANTDNGVALFLEKFLLVGEAQLP